MKETLVSTAAPASSANTPARETTTTSEGPSLGSVMGMTNDSTIALTAPSEPSQPDPALAPEVVSLTVVFIYILGLVQPLMAIEFSLSGALRGAGDTRWPLISVISGFIGVRLTLATLFWWLGLSVEWVYAALIGDYIVKSIVLTVRFGGGRWQTLTA